MDFALPHLKQDGVAVKSKIRILPTATAATATATATANGNNTSNQGTTCTCLDDKLIAAANQAARELLDYKHKHTSSNNNNSNNNNSSYNNNNNNIDWHHVNAAHYPERILPTTSIIEPGALIVIFESFDTLNFVYAKPGDHFRNRNGCFPHDDFIGKPFGSIVRSRDHQGYGFVYLLKPTPELWARSLTHRTQIVHELDASMICWYLELRPNMVVCESGTGSGALSHAILRSIAPGGKLHTFEFNESRATRAREEFAKNQVTHLVDVTHRDVCGKNAKTNAATTTTTTTTTIDNYDDTGGGGFGLQQQQGGQRAHAVMLDLPEPWLAVPHAAFVLKRGGRIASYSPCMEQAQRCIAALNQKGFHSIRTLEFRLREHYVDEVDLWPPPKEKRPRLEVNEQQHLSFVQPINNGNGNGNGNGNDNGKDESDAVAGNEDAKTEQVDKVKGRKMICTRPFNNMRGHTAFLTFATAGNILQPDPCLIHGDKNPC